MTSLSSSGSLSAAGSEVMAVDVNLELAGGCDFGKVGQTDSTATMLFVGLLVALAVFGLGGKGGGEEGRRRGAADAESVAFFKELRRRCRLFLTVLAASRWEEWSLAICFNTAISL